MFDRSFPDLTKGATDFIKLLRNTNTEELLESIGKQRKMRRRDFIGRSLALTAAATRGLVSSSMAAAAAGTKAAWLSHYTYVAPDLAETSNWYHEVFGMQIGHQDATEAHLWYGDEGGDTLMIVRQARAGEKAPRIERFGFILDDWDRNAVQAELRETSDGGRDVYQWFGDSVWIPTAIREGAQTSFELDSLDHVAYTIADYDSADVEVELRR